MEHGTVDPKKLKPNPWNTNHVDTKNQAKLRTSVKELGFFRPIVVRTLPDGSLQILGGQHRTEAAIDLGLKSVPYFNLGVISDEKAKKIGLADNSRYGADDSIKLAKLIEELADPDLTTILPLQDEDLQAIMRAVDIDLDSLDVLPEETPEEDKAPPEERPDRPLKTHEIMTFRVTCRDAEAIRNLIEKTIKREGLDDGSDEKTLAGSALAHLLLNGE